jgi:hypothetical protein
VDAAGYLKGRTRETTIRRDAHGRWFFEGQPLEHPNLTRSFDGWIERAEDGRYCLRNDINWAYITLSGPPFFVESLQLDDTGVQLRLSGGREEALDPDTLRQDEHGVLYCDVREGTMAARFTRHAQAALADVTHEDAQGVYLAIGSRRIRPPLVADPLSPARPETA